MTTVQAEIASTRSTAARVAEITALVCGVGWVGKILLIAASGGKNSDAGLVAVGWAVGFAGLLATGAALGYLAGRQLGKAAAVLAAVAGVPIAFTVMNVADGIAKAAVSGSGWFRDELSLLVLGSVCLLGGLLALRGRRAG